MNIKNLIFMVLVLSLSNHDCFSSAAAGSGSAAAEKVDQKSVQEKRKRKTKTERKMGQMLSALDKADLDMITKIIDLGFGINKKVSKHQDGSFLHYAIYRFLDPVNLRRDIEVRKIVAMGKMIMEEDDFEGPAMSVEDIVEESKKMVEQATKKPTALELKEQIVINEIKLLPIIAFLVKKGLNVNALDSKGFTALDIAKSYNNEAIIKLLTSYGALTAEELKKAAAATAASTVYPAGGPALN